MAAVCRFGRFMQRLACGSTFSRYYGGPGMHYGPYATRCSRVLTLPVSPLAFMACSLHSNNNIKDETSLTYASSKSSFKIEIAVKVTLDKKLTEDPAGYSNLQKLFRERKHVLFEYTDKLKTMRCFSALAIDLFKKLYLIALEEGQDAGSHFKYDASQILVKENSVIVEHVAIPVSQFRTGNSIYIDKVVGTVTSLIYSLCEMEPGLSHKELLHLMELAQSRRLSAEEVLKHPLFWTPEDKYAGILASRIFLSDGRTKIVNSLMAKGQVRTRVLTDFDTAVGKDDYFNIDLSASINSDGEYSVSRIQLVPPKKWEDLFIPSSFPNDYRKNISVFGRGAKDRTVKLVIFTRDILGHFGDDNMEVYASNLADGTLRIAVIDLDRKFSLSLTIYDALKQKQVPTMPLAVNV